MSEHTAQVAKVMPNHPLFHPVHESVRSAEVRDHIQIALAIADGHALKSLLVNCIPAIAQLRHIADVSSQVAVPTQEQQAADGILHFEAVQCVPAQSNFIDLQPHTGGGGWTRESRELARLTQHVSEMHTLGQNLALAPMVSLLAASGLTPKQIDEILRLPQDGWHKSWWYAIDVDGNFTRPFLRHIRTLHYSDGTLTIQYKDFFEQEKPHCFSTLPQQVLVAVKSDVQGFGETLRQINAHRQVLGIARAILICNTVSELEAQAFINQGISIYPAIELVLPIRSNCAHCGRRECPMNGATASPIALCYGYLPEAEFV